MQRPKVTGAADEEWLTSAEAADYVKFNRRSFLRRVRNGEIRGYVLCGTKRRVWRFRKCDLDAMLLARSVGVISSVTPSVLVAKGEEE
jgi:excisionase family DNA binding protein